MKSKKSNRTFKEYVKWMWITILGGTGFIIFIFLLASWGIFGKLPTFEELENPDNDLATEIIAMDGVTLGKYFKENRTSVKYKDLPQNLIDALVATEDERFFEHSGIDFKATVRAVVKMGKDGGGSTITQQLAKLLFHGEGAKNLSQRVIQKIKEYVIAVRLERQYTKEEILAMYLNTQDFLFQAVGIKSAAKIYFNKEPKDLTVEESAVLVAMLKNPRQFNPHRERSKEKSFERRNVVLNQMVKYGYLNNEVKDSLKTQPIELDFTPEGHAHGTATYFREHLRDFMKKWIKDNPKPDGSPYSLHSDGLKIYVTIDSRMQTYAEEAVAEHMANLQRVFFKQQKYNKTAPFYDITKSQVEATITQAMKRSNRWRRMKRDGASEKEIRKSFDTKTDMEIFTWKGEVDTIMTPRDSILYYKHILRSGLLSIEPQTGYIKAWVGGINYKHFQYDAVEQQKRQVGSTFKPFVYATAINQLNLSPCQKFPNIPYTINKDKYKMPKNWTPKNATSKYGGMLTLKQALANSVNVITARLIDMVHPINVANLAHRAGIKSEIPEVPSIALGSVDLSLYEMVGAYSTFANKGLQIEPMMILKIEDKNGTLLEEFVPNVSEVLNEESAYVILNLLEGVTQSGSGVRLRSKWGRYPDDVATGYPYEFTNPIAGKTGTTQNQSDGWFMGIVPNLATGVWVGGEDRATHFSSITFGQGATMALPIWALYYQKLYADEGLNVSNGEFEKPDQISIELDCSKVIFETNEDEENTDILNEEDPDF
ncbi:MAG TPA: transglycosylase domain-containing protein [Flavobacteriaceae bacterium]|nr:transglycosylase domain-containing protein [Flavobacteriaceae bacterium]